MKLSIDTISAAIVRLELRARLLARNMERNIKIFKRASCLSKYLVVLHVSISRQRLFAYASQNVAPGDGCCPASPRENRAIRKIRPLRDWVLKEAASA
jgi:hypothetical protein